MTARSTSPRFGSNPPGLARAALAVAFGLAAAAGGWWLLAPLPLAGQPAAGPPPLALQTAAAAELKSTGCLSCHAGIEPMHAAPTVKLGCTDCHGGDAAAEKPPGSAPEAAEYAAAKARAHVAPRFPELWAGAGGERSAANPQRSFTLLNRESPEFVRFVNPGDLRVARETCGPCHAGQVNATERSPMTTSAIFWAAAAYANGILPLKGALFGESYGREGAAQSIVPGIPPTAYELEHGARSELVPLPRWETIQPGEYFRAFERGGILQPSTFPEIGNPNVVDEPGRPDIRFSNRGRGTGLRISPALINLHKTRLNDPHLSFLGTNDHPGDYRSSGCTACHTVYANDRDPVHSGPWAGFGHRGESATDDPTIARGEPGHPIRHRLTRAIPSSQCMVCHMHQPNAFLNTYLGYTMWDYETEGERLWPERQAYPTAAQQRASLERNPEGAATRGRWGEQEFLERLSEMNAELRDTQFSDYHGHGWVFRAVYKQDRKGNLLDHAGKTVAPADPDRLRKAVHLRDIHLERGMHCVDCHFSQDNHGDGLLHGDYGAAVEIQCQDCHGTIKRATNLLTSGPAAPPGGRDLALGTTPFGTRRFQWRETDTGRRLFQRSMLTAGQEWEVEQVLDTVTAGNPRYNPRAARAKTLARDGGWGDATLAAGRLAHGDARMTCDSCHSSWITSCSGCHLPQEANVKSPMLHYEGTETRNFASYNPQVIRTDAFMLGIDGTVKGNRIAPVRSSSALVLSSTNLNRQRVYLQQPPISAPGFSSQAFNSHVPHTIRTAEARRCDDCHVSANNDNNAWMAQLLLLGTNFVNFTGRYAWVGLGASSDGGGNGVEAVAVTEWDEPQAVIGSYLHRLAYPDYFARHQGRRLELAEAHEHHGPRGQSTRSLQLRGEYLFAALGRGGLRVYDVANIDNKDFSERIVSAPVSPWGQRLHVPTRDAAAVALPTTMPVAPARRTSAEHPENLEQPMHPIYRYAFVADREEGLVVVDVGTTTDGDPENNFLARTPILGQASFNPEGILTGASNLAIAGDFVYVTCARGLVVIDFGVVEQPRVVAVVAEVERPTAVQVQFRYAFVTDRQGLAVVEVTDPRRPRLVARAGPIADARNVYVARTYAYVAAGKQGVVIVDVERPEEPRIDQVFDAGGQLDDVWDVKVSAAYASLFGYVADGRHGLRVLQLTSPASTPGYLGFSPRPAPQLIATRHTAGMALALSKGLDRDRAVDESGHQVSVFNRLGARPFSLEQMQRLYLREGTLYTVTNDPEPETTAPQVPPPVAFGGQTPDQLTPRRPPP